MALMRERNRRAIDLVETWLDDDSDYDEEVWPRVKASIEENRLSYRARFAEDERPARKD